MRAVIGRSEFIAMIRGAITGVRDGCDYLSELDSECGDGDHGTTMRRAVNLLEKSLAEEGEECLRAFIDRVAWTLLGIDGGATGPLLGSLFMGMAEAVADRQELDSTALAAVFEAGLASVQARTKARVGDKTMIDALDPAVRTMRASAEAGKSPVESLRDGAVAARNGAGSTKSFVAKFGKAKFAAERTLGHQDAGATSVAMIFEGFWAGLAEHIKCLQAFHCEPIR